MRDMFDSIAPKYDRLNRIISLGLDRRCRKRTVRSLGPPTGSPVLGLASGTGDLCFELVVAGFQPLSMDLSFGMLAADRSGAPCVQTDILRLPTAAASVDGATRAFALRNLSDLPEFFAELARVVRPGGCIALLELSKPRNRILRFGSGLYFTHIVPKIGALLSAAYRYLPKSMAYLPKTPTILWLSERFRG